MLSGSNARHFSTTVSQWLPEDKNLSLTVLMNDFEYSIQMQLLEFIVCSLIMLIDYPQSLTNADILGQGNLNSVSEKSGKSQGILLSIICGNPDELTRCGENSVDPDQLASKKPADLDIHCFHLIVFISGFILF